jgi:hypothetical protein
MLQTSISRIDTFRDAHPEHPILDVQYDDLVQAPVDTVARIYEAFGDELSEHARAAIESHVAANRRGRFGEHRYDLTEFGVAEGEIAERFATYVDRYDIPVARW